ncbi:transposase [Xenorhabdus miraniensis]|uniref:Transposase n=1 Tax=Xenorhabdus miraniensis TaxID=351674 RepID=A0A2D0J733_9GAMM|nr:transposase [Xenorhabdus miraniensis]
MDPPVIREQQAPTFRHYKAGNRRGSTPHFSIPAQCQRLSEWDAFIIFLILFHMSHYRDFKTFYNEHVKQYPTADFPGLVSYTRMLTLKKRALIPLCAFLSSRKATTQGIAFIDSTKIAVCHNLRIPRHRVFEGMAQRGKTSTG